MKEINIKRVCANVRGNQSLFCVNIDYNDLFYHPMRNSKIRKLYLDEEIVIFGDILKILHIYVNQNLVAPFEYKVTKLNMQRLRRSLFFTQTNFNQIPLLCTLCLCAKLS